MIYKNATHIYYLANLLSFAQWLSFLTDFINLIKGDEWSLLFAAVPGYSQGAKICAAVKPQRGLTSIDIGHTLISFHYPNDAVKPVRL